MIYLLFNVFIQNKHSGYVTRPLTVVLLALSSAEDEAATWTAYMGKMFSAASSYLPAPVSGMMSQDRAFATVHLLSSGQRNVCTLVT